MIIPRLAFRKKWLLPRRVEPLARKWNWLGRIWLDYHYIPSYPGMPKLAFERYEWEDYVRDYDTAIHISANTVSRFYAGYPFVVVYDMVWDFTGKDNLASTVMWCKENLSGKWRTDCLRVSEDDAIGGWRIDGIAGFDEQFFAFERSEDFVWFAMKYGRVES
jgi:hypothetical protein